MQEPTNLPNEVPQYLTPKEGEMNEKIFPENTISEKTTIEEFTTILKERAAKLEEWFTSTCPYERTSALFKQHGFEDPDFWLRWLRVPSDDTQELDVITKMTRVHQALHMYLLEINKDISDIIFAHNAVTTDPTWYAYFETYIIPHFKGLSLDKVTKQ